MDMRPDADAVAPTSPVKLRGGEPRSLHVALVLLSVAVFFLGILQVAIGLADREMLWALAMFTGLLWVWIAAGVLAWWRRPENASGALIVIGGFAAFLGGLPNLGIDVLIPIGAVFATSVLAVAVHLLHAFPSGRLHGRLSVMTVVLAYFVSIGLDAMRYLVPADRPDLMALAGLIQRVLGLTAVAVTAVILSRRLWAADAAHRRVLLPLFMYGIVAIVLIPLTAIVLQPLGVSAASTATVQLALLAGLPIAFVWGVLRGGFVRSGALDALSSWLASGEASGSAVVRALATTLGDPSLQLFYWDPARTVFIDESGTEVDIQVGAPDRGTVEVKVGPRRVGAIAYDTRMIGDASPVRRAGGVLAIAVDRERLIAELLATNDALLQSRLRLVETADRERARIAQDLHDGLQVQLVLLGMDAQAIGNAPHSSPETTAKADDLRRRIDGAAADLRRLVHNVQPAALVEQGLLAATEDLVDRLVIPASLDAEFTDDQLSPATTQTAYFVVAEALANAVKHSLARSVSVGLHLVRDTLVIEVADDGVGGATIERGTGLRGLVDRVDVLGGTVTVTSARGCGTRLRAELPCAQ